MSKVNKRLNKEDLFKMMAKEAGLTQEEARKALSAFMKIVLRTLEDDGEVMLVDFGTFYTIKTKKRKVNSRFTNGEELVPSYKDIKFRFSKTLRKKIRENKEKTE